MRYLGFAILAVVAGAAFGEPVHVPVGAWTMTRLDSGVLVVYRTESPDGLLIGCRPIDGPGTRLHVQRPDEEMSVVDGADALAVLAPVWLDDDGTNMNRAMAGMLFNVCLGETVSDVLVEAHRQRTAREARAIVEPMLETLDAASERLAAQRVPEPYITREEIEARFQPMRDRIAETEAVLDEMARDALDDYRGSRRARGRAYRDEGYELEPITIPRYEESTRE